MAVLRGRQPKWDRFAFWAPGAAMLALLLTAAVLLAAALTTRVERNPPTAVSSLATQASAGQAGRDTDLRLYDQIAARVASGESYYKAAVEAQRAGNFPVRPALAVRLPTLAYIEAWAGPTGLAALMVLLALAVLLAWWRRLGEEPGGSDHRLISVLLLWIGAGIALKAKYLVLHEMWAGMLLALAFALYRPGRWKEAWVAVALALAIRELALPFALLLAAMAWWRRDWRETLAWGVLIAAFCIGLTVHIAQVDQYITVYDRLSPSWLALRGLDGWSGNIILSTGLYLLPAWLAAPLALLPLLGWAGWNTEAGRFGFLLFLGYGVFFMIAGRANNFYWGLMITPAWFVGLTFVPRALKSLLASAKGQ